MTPHKCPVCDGTGLVSRPPGVAGDWPVWTSTNRGPYECRACYGEGIIWGPPEEDHEQAIREKERWVTVEEGMKAVTKAILEKEGR